MTGRPSGAVDLGGRGSSCGVHIHKNEVTHKGRQSARGGQASGALAQGRGPRQRWKTALEGYYLVPASTSGQCDGALDGVATWAANKGRAGGIHGHR